MLEYVNFSNKQYQKYTFGGITMCFFFNVKFFSTKLSLPCLLYLLSVYRRVTLLQHPISANENATTNGRIFIKNMQINTLVNCFFVVLSARRYSPKT